MVFVWWVNKDMSEVELGYELFNQIGQLVYQMCRISIMARVNQEYNLVQGYKLEQEALQLGNSSSY